MPLGKRNDCGEAKYAGLDVDFCQDLQETLEASFECGFDFLIAPLVHPRYRRRPTRQLPNGQLAAPFTRSDLLLNSTRWSSQIVGRASPWIDCDSRNAPLAADSCAALQQELEWAAHLTLQAVVLPSIAQPMGAASYARILNQVMNGLSNMALWQPIPLALPSASNDDISAVSNAPAASPAAAAAATAKEADAAAAAAAGSGGGCSHAAAQCAVWEARQQDPWEWWQQLRTLCEFQPKLGVVLEVPASLPSDTEIERWYGEPVRALLLPTSLFITNRKGYPTLSKRHQHVVTAFMRMTVQVVLSGNPHSTPPADVSEAAKTLVISPDGEPVSTHPLRPYWEYLSYLFRRQDALHAEEMVEVNYRDYLQAPLQPLQDNLESATYETFERDTTKYTTYEEAVYRALMDRVPDSEASSRTTVLMVVGAGRGPLVRASLRASARAGRKLRVYAVEKNPNALITLQNLVVSERWEEQVTVVGSDMRVWQAPEKADILVSELLGSFGDNELSPECLDGAQRFLRDDGISIPCKYTSYMHPVTASKMWDAVKAYNDLEHYETPYVVKLFRYTSLAAIQPVFTFEHPNPAEIIDNTRSISMEFERSGEPSALCHGLAGYFDTQLYGDVYLSINPDTHTPDMFSWFPIYFPLRTPVYLPAGAPVKVHMWRCARAHKVWYEWALTGPQTTTIHNPNGRSYYVGL